MKKAGATKVGTVSYGASASSTAAAKNLQKYAVPAAGLDPAYTNTTVEFGTTDVGPLVLGMKNAGVDATYLPLVLSSNLAIIQNAAQNNLKFKLAVLATGYGQSLLDEPASKTIGPEVLFAQIWAPVELKTAATKKFQADLKKYGGYEGVPDFGVYTGYLTADLLVQGPEGRREGPHPRRLHHRHQGTRDVGRGRPRLPAGRRERGGLRQAAADRLLLVRADQERQVRPLPEQEPDQGQADPGEHQRIGAARSESRTADRGCVGRPSPRGLPARSSSSMRASSSPSTSVGDLSGVLAVSRRGFRRRRLEVVAAEARALDEQRFPARLHDHLHEVVCVQVRGRR